MIDRYGSSLRARAFPFQQGNRSTDGTWEAPLADRDNILGTSVDPHEPQWPRWKKTPPLHHEGDFVSDDPFFDIDEISGKVEFYPPGRPLRDGNVDGHPARRQRIDDLPAGNSWRRRLLVGGGEDVDSLFQPAGAPVNPREPQPGPGGAGSSGGGTGQLDVEPPGFTKTPHESIPGLYRFYTTEWSWQIDAQGRPRPVPPGWPYLSRDDNNNGIPDLKERGSPEGWLMRPRTS